MLKDHMQQGTPATLCVKTSVEAVPVPTDGNDSTVI